MSPFLPPRVISSLPLHWVGLHPFLVRAEFGYGSQNSKGQFLVVLGAPRGAYVDLYGHTPIWYWIDANSSFSPSGLEQRKKLYNDHEAGTKQAAHEDFFVYKPCWTTYGGGETLETLLGQDPSPATRAMAFDRDLSCLTRFKSCTELCQIAPRTWAQLLDDGGHGCDMFDEYLARARRVCGEWAGRIGERATIN